MEADKLNLLVDKEIQILEVDKKVQLMKVDKHVHVLVGV